MSLMEVGAKCARCKRTCSLRPGETLCVSCSSMPMGTDPERNWPEDAPHENGNYYCTCCHCGESFVGHKRRVVCKVCHNKPELSAGRLMCYVFGAGLVITGIVIWIWSRL